MKINKIINLYIELNINYISNNIININKKINNIISYKFIPIKLKYFFIQKYKKELQNILNQIKIKQIENLLKILQQEKKKTSLNNINTITLTEIYQIIIIQLKIIKEFYYKLKNFNFIIDNYINNIIFNINSYIFKDFNINNIIKITNIKNNNKNLKNIKLDLLEEIELYLYNLNKILNKEVKKENINIFSLEYIKLLYIKEILIKNYQKISEYINILENYNYPYLIIQKENLKHLKNKIQQKLLNLKNI